MRGDGVSKLAVLDAVREQIGLADQQQYFLRQAFGDRWRLRRLRFFRGVLASVVGSSALASSAASFSGFQWPTTANTGTFVGSAATGGSMASRMACGGRNEKFSPSAASKLGRPPEYAVSSGWIADQLALPGSSLSRSGGASDGSARSWRRSIAGDDAAGRQSAIDPKEAAVADLQQLGVLPGDLKFEPDLEVFATPLLPVAADAVELLSADGNLVSQARGNAGAAFQLAGRLHQQSIAGAFGYWFAPAKGGHVLLRRHRNERARAEALSRCPRPGDEAT